MPKKAQVAVVNDHAIEQILAALAVNVAEFAICAVAEDSAIAIRLLDAACAAGDSRLLVSA